MESPVTLEQFHQELRSWKEELSLSKQEIGRFERQLGDMALKKNSKKQLSLIEHFQNSFICQKEVIDILRHDLPDSHYKVEDIFKTFGHNDAHPGPSEDVLKQRMAAFRKMYTEMKEDFRRFREVDR